MPHFGFQADREGFFGELLHLYRRSLWVESMKILTGAATLARAQKRIAAPLIPRAAGGL
jgi:hypothetical protein